MSNPLSLVAYYQRVDEVALTKFALENKEKYSIFFENNVPMVSNFFSDDLVNDFRKIIN